MIHSSEGVRLAYAIDCIKEKIPIIFFDRLSRALLANKYQFSYPVLVYWGCQFTWAQFSILDTGCSILDAGCSILDAGCSILDTGCSILDTGCSMLDAGC